MNNKQRWLPKFNRAITSKCINVKGVEKRLVSFRLFEIESGNFCFSSMFL